MCTKTLILHSDLNCFYASVEMNEQPQLQGKRIAVCGSTENRHGIVLTASYPAKRMGVKTGMANWQALQVCPDLICVPPRYELYLKYSQKVRSIYKRYSDFIEPFGMDENWIALPRYQGDYEAGKQIAEEIRSAVHNETGITVSIGVSFSKIFAKLGSDMKKPDAVTIISESDYREKVWPLPVSELLYAGPATTKKLMKLNIRTIGELANTDPSCIHRLLGKNGLYLWQYANGTDGAKVMPSDYEAPIKSIGHGATCVTDLYSDMDVWRVLYELAQDVHRRMLKHNLNGLGVSLTVRDNELVHHQYQMMLPLATRTPVELAQAAFTLFQDQYRWQKPVRALTIRAILLQNDLSTVQLDMFHTIESHQKKQRAADAIDTIRHRFGSKTIMAASLLEGTPMANDKCETVPMPSPMYR